MKEFDTRVKAKELAEFITPSKLRDFLASKINGNNLTILEPAIGSGQLLFNIKDKISIIDGYDVNDNAINVAKENFAEKINIFNQDFITCDINKQYDIAIANYPFSLKPTEEQKQYICNDKYLSKFYDKEAEPNMLGNFAKKIKTSNITGVLDFVFILKSFNLANEGYYFCFPGIGYRQQEKVFREYLIKNKYIKEYGIISNCQFDHTSISILFLHLTKERNETTKSFNLDLKTNEIIEAVANFDNAIFNMPQKEVAKEVVDPVELEKQARESVLNIVQHSLNCSKMICELDQNLQNNLPFDDFKKSLIQAIENI